MALEGMDCTFERSVGVELEWFGGYKGEGGFAVQLIKKAAGCCGHMFRRVCGVR